MSTGDEPTTFCCRRLRHNRPPRQCMPTRCPEWPAPIGEHVPPAGGLPLRRHGCREVGLNGRSQRLETTPIEFEVGFSPCAAL